MQKADSSVTSKTSDSLPIVAFTFLRGVWFRQTQTQQGGSAEYLLKAFNVRFSHSASLLISNVSLMALPSLTIAS